jgi:hypothetical protein
MNEKNTEKHRASYLCRKVGYPVVSTIANEIPITYVAASSNSEIKAIHSTHLCFVRQYSDITNLVAEKNKPISFWRPSYFLKEGV